ncbi:ArnT family glycosyltransferase [Sunxiuqinia sp. sy24]|uniref:ArnT family glycosyltransferase n=1 Tax=Sunxiuqinia sp. sy24 TaxID=3461495 RepID=UPI0040464931
MLKQIKIAQYYPWFIFLFALVIYLSNLGASSIYILDEAKNSTCAAEMFERGDVIVPTFNQELRTDKPPLHYFFMMLSYAIFGVNAFAARFFSAVFGALTILITFLFVRRFHSEKAALWSSFVLLSSIHLTIQFHLAVPDPYLIFFFTASIYAFYAAVKEKRFIDLLLLYASIGLGTLSKGPVAIGLPGLVFLLFLILSKRFKWSEIKQLRPFMGAAIVLLIALPWYILVHLKTNGLWSAGFFLKHNLGRFSSEMEGHGGLFILTLFFVLIGLFPFSAFIIQAIKKAFANRKDDFTLLSLVTGITIVVFFSISRTKLPNYTVPAYPFFAILLGLWLSQLKVNESRLKGSMLGLLIFSLLLVPALYIGIKFDPALAHLNYLAFYFLPIPLGMIAAYYLFSKQQIIQSLQVVGLSTILGALCFIAIVFPKIDQENPVVKSIHLLESKEVRYFQKFNPSFAFYLQREIEFVEADQFANFFNEYPDGVIISTKRKLEGVRLPNDMEVTFSSRDIMERPTTVLLTRKK